MTELSSTLFRVVSIGSKRYALGLHPCVKETLLSIREVGRRAAYVVPVSTVRVHAAFAYGRAERAAKAEARRNGVPWQKARKIFMAGIVPPFISGRKTKGGAS